MLYILNRFNEYFTISNSQFHKRTKKKCEKNIFNNVITTKFHNTSLIQLIKITIL